jgi:transposase
MANYESNRTNFNHYYKINGRSYISSREVAALYGVSQMTAIKWINKGVSDKGEIIRKITLLRGENSESKQIRCN